LNSGKQPFLKAWSRDQGAVDIEDGERQTAGSATRRFRTGEAPENRAAFAVDELDDHGQSTNETENDGNHNQPLSDGNADGAELAPGHWRQRR
jgi:hypothetical protein